MGVLAFRFLPLGFTSFGLLKHHMVTCTGEVISRAFGGLVFQLGHFYKPAYHMTTKKLSLKKYRGRNGCWLPPCH